MVGRNIFRKIRNEGKRKKKERKKESNKEIKTFSFDEQQNIYEKQKVQLSYFSVNHAQRPHMHGGQPLIF